ncbi:tetratricopeptide repeat protein 19 homolog, mitochondrial [Maniola hyperantus]|uniref:tetratricopeptide repeat protein 19 homolog, mitochondrial n=1 Tax=Aphantopus hyperantus TaxID=2795564 RepID=UPI001568736C|nr:tetratricopeptide repeat protein 19 homolog, mitochondrial [Maniola hyperantus]
MTSKYRLFWRKFMHVKFYCKQVSQATHKTHQKVTLPSTLGFSLLTLLEFEKKMNAEDELILTIKHCVLFVQRGEFDKAEQLLHVALKQAQQIRHQLGITYIYDVMANLALEREQYEKAKQLFIAVTQRIMADGATEDDPRVIHISAKLARISHMKKEYSTAQLGYEWCLEKLNNAYKTDPSEPHRKLLAMTEDWYGRLFLDCDKIEIGLNYMKKAYERMKDLVDIEQEHLVIQLNDMGTVCDRLGNVDESIEYYSKAIDLGKKFPDMHDLGAMYVNLGRAYIKKNMLDIARKSCGQGWRLGVTTKNNDVKREAEICMQEIRAMS